MAAASAGSLAAASAGAEQERRPKERFRPRIVGTPREGVVLKATRGTWTSSRPVAYRYRWFRCPAGGPKCVRIRKANRARFRPTSVEVGTRLRVTVTATNATGSASATSRLTAPVSVSGNGRVVALWHLDETAGSVMNDSAGTNDGTIYRVALGVPGVVGTAYGFNGENSFVSVPSAAALNPDTANITLSVRLKTTLLPPPPPSDFDLIRKGTYGASEYKVELQHSGQASCGFEGSAGYSELIAGPRINDGQWHLVQCVKAPTAIQLVVDGKTFTQAANVGSISNAAALVIGSRPDGDWYAGALDEISIATG
jgi:hypothetical protein